MDILKYFFDNAQHFIQLCIIIILVCPWHWRSRKIHTLELAIPNKKKEEKETLTAHG